MEADICLEALGEAFQHLREEEAKRGEEGEELENKMKWIYRRWMCRKDQLRTSLMSFTSR